MATITNPTNVLALMSAQGSQLVSHINFLDIDDKHGSWGLGERLETVRDTDLYKYATAVGDPEPQRY